MSRPAVRVVPDPLGAERSRDAGRASGHSTEAGPRLVAGAISPMVSSADEVVDDRAGLPLTGTRGPCKPLHIEREWSTDREAILAALRVALGLPRALPHRDEEAA